MRKHGIEILSVFHSGHFSRRYSSALVLESQCTFHLPLSPSLWSWGHQGPDKPSDLPKVPQPWSQVWDPKLLTLSQSSFVTALHRGRYPFCNFPPPPLSWSLFLCHSATEVLPVSRSGWDLKSKILGNITCMPPPQPINDSLGPGPTSPFSLV